MLWYFGCKTCGILATWTGIEPAPPALGGEVLATALPGKSQNSPLINKIAKRKQGRWPGHGSCTLPSIPQQIHSLLHPPCVQQAGLSWATSPMLSEWEALAGWEDGEIGASVPLTQPPDLQQTSSGWIPPQEAPSLRTSSGNVFPGLPAQATPPSLLLAPLWLCHLFPVGIPANTTSKHNQ